MLRFSFFSLVFSLLVLCSACDESAQSSEGIFANLEDNNPNYFCDEISNKINNFTFVGKYGHIHNEWLIAAVEEAYSANDWKPIWQNFESGQYYQAALDFLAETEKAAFHQLDPEKYHTKSNRALLDSLYISNRYSGNEELAYKVELDLALTACTLSYLADLRKGKYSDPRWEIPNPYGNLAQDLLSKLAQAEEAIKAAAPPYKSYWKLAEKIGEFKKIEGGFPSISSEKNAKGLAEQLYKLGDLNSGNISSFDEELKAGLVRFQERNGLEGSGKLNKATLAALNKPIAERIEQMQLNLERFRWLPHDMNKEHVWVNVPDYQIEVRENDETKLKMKGVVGEPITPTPVFTEKMSHLVFSPAWNIPWSIVRDEIFAYAGYGDFPSVLILADVEVFYEGKKLDPFKVEWKTITKDKKEMRKYRFRQKPGTGNSLGTVKFIFPNKHAVYLHDTSSKKYFGWQNRALSAGCIRVEKPVELSKHLLRGKEDWDEQRIKSNMYSSSERRVNLAEEVPVYLYYLTSWVNESGALQFRKDIYKHDRKQIAKMKKEGLFF